MAQMNNLTTLIKRLEAATSRLEDLVPHDASEPAIAHAFSSSSVGAQNKNLATAPTAESLPAAIIDFDGIISTDVQTYVRMSEEIGGLVAEQSAAVLRAFSAERKFLLITTKSRKPDIQSTIYMEILKELQSTMSQVNDIREANRASPLFTHLTTVSEGIAVLGWITIDPKPADYVGEVLSSAQFYGNRIINLNKDKDKQQVAWVNSFYNIFKKLVSYVQSHHARGVVWNANGQDPELAFKDSQNPDPTASSMPPPPPPLPALESTPKSKGGSDMGAVFGELSRGSAVTAGLKKVDASQMNHKNPALRARTGPTPEPSARSTTVKSTQPKRPPRTELEGTKWLIENHEAPAAMIEIDAAISHSILISRCAKTTVRIKGKANAISIDNSPQLSLVIDSLVSSVDVIHSTKFEMQVLGVLPTVMLDQVDSAQIYLGIDTLGTEIFTSKCSAINVNLPGCLPDDDYREHALPEQIKSVVRKGVLVSEIVEHAG